VQDLIRDKRWADALALLGPAATANGAVLRVLRAYALLMARDFAAADADAASALAVDEWSVEAMVVRGLVAKWQDRTDEAIRWFRQAAYCRRDCWPVHFYLGELYRALGQDGPAQRCFRVALQQIGANPNPDGGLLLPLGLPVAEVTFLCRRHAGQMSGVGGER
jgi:chemotaxis protein methyltransferase CheR